MKTKYKITKANPETSPDGYHYQIDFDITGKGSTPDQKNLNLGFTKTMIEAINYTMQKMHDPVRDEIVIDHKCGEYKAQAQAMGGAKSKRKITPEQQAKLQKARAKSREEKKLKKNNPLKSS